MASSVNMFSANAKTDAEPSTGKKTNEAMLKRIRGYARNDAGLD